MFKYYFNYKLKHIKFATFFFFFRKNVSKNRSNRDTWIIYKLEYLTREIFLATNDSFACNRMEYQFNGEMSKKRMVY